MGILPGRHRTKGSGLAGERCDRCAAPARVRVGKHIVVGLREFDDGQPYAVDSRELDLALCGHDFGLHRDALSQQGWRVIESVTA